MGNSTKQIVPDKIITLDEFKMIHPQHIDAQRNDLVGYKIFICRKGCDDDEECKYNYYVAEICRPYSYNIYEMAHNNPNHKTLRVYKSRRFYHTNAMCQELKILTLVDIQKRIYSDLNNSRYGRKIFEHDDSVDY